MGGAADQRRLAVWALAGRRRKAESVHVPYDQLPESEKKYDRSMVDQTLRCILKLGYRVLPADGRDNEVGSPAATQR